MPIKKCIPKYNLDNSSKSIEKVHLGTKGTPSMTITSVCTGTSYSYSSNF